ncbi:MAG: hypothetical protein LC134_09755 [Chitinophagales bacterium]|nr:hypothetical protein [Chitinophagales bacterium]
MKLLSTLLFGLLLSSCYSQKRTITFINQSEFIIDSIGIGVSSADSYSIKYVNINTSDSVITVIPHNEPRSNNHDITVDITIYIKDHSLIYSYNYNDLSGYLANDYTIVLNKKREVRWILGSKIDKN